METEDYLMNIENDFENTFIDYEFEINDPIIEFLRRI
jgi:hypothetical protein